MQNKKSEQTTTATFSDHVLDKSMWTGDHYQSDNPTWLYDGRIYFARVKYTPSLLKILDEIVVNSCDHCVEMAQENVRYKVTEIAVTFDIATGRIAVYNNGDGLSLLPNKQGKTKAELILTKNRTGSNIKVDPTRITGGTNGYGIKLIACLNDQFLVETVDAYLQKTFRMKIEKNATIKHVPQIIDSTKAPYTKIIMRPSYKLLDYGDYNEETGKILDKLFLSRTYFVAVYLYTIGIKPNCEVKYNNTAFKVPSFAELPILFGIEKEKYKTTTITQPLIWNVAIFLRKNSQQSQFSIVNGIVCNGGSHIDYIIAILLEAIVAKFGTNKKFDSMFAMSTNKQQKIHKYIKNAVNRLIGVIFIGQIFSPSWVGQVKNAVSTKPNAFQKFVLPNDFIKNCVDLVSAEIERLILLDVSKPLRTKNVKLTFKKYHKAKYANAKTGHKCTLFIVEGDSARSTIEKVIESKHNTLSYQYCGIYNIQGVPNNARKMIANRYLDGDKEIVIPRADLFDTENVIRLHELALIVGLKYNVPEVDKKKLNYGKIVVAVDQDTDGIGKIFSLLCNFFELYWPNLVRDGYIFRLDTPVIRAYKRSNNKQFVEFYLNEDFRKWESKNDTKLWRIEYYKGLATHTASEVANMSKDVLQHYRKYYCDEESRKYFDIYYNANSQPRKEEYVKPPLADEDPSGDVSFTFHLRKHTKLFVLEENKRKFPHVYDGLVPSKRKVLAYMRTKPTKKQKTYQWCGKIAGKMCYHHGNKSLEDVISRMAQSFIGANNLPLLLPDGDFGSRSGGPKVFGSPRYTATSLNAKLVNCLIPREDDDLLDYVVEDGQICEPEYYVPIIPLAILENHQCAGNGWKFYIWGRHIDKVIANVRTLIAEKDDLHDLKYCVWLQDKYDENNDLIPNRMEMRSGISARYGLTEYCYGSYYVENDSVYITDLPIGIWSTPYIEEIKKKSLIDSVEFTSISSDIDICVNFVAGGINKIMDAYGDALTDPIEEYLLLRKCTRSIINLSHNNGIKEFDDKYNDVIKFWFDERKRLYIERLVRLKILLECEILMFENLIRFINDKDISITNRRDKDVLISLLDERKYAKINRPKLYAPKNVTNRELRNVILDQGNYDYLINLRQVDLVLDKQDKRKKKLIGLKEQLTELNTITWRQIWLKELDELVKVIDAGIKTNWKF